MSTFKRAQRKRVWIKLAITGPSGSGKTYSALQLARGLGGKVAMLDTENGSGSLYSDLCEYDVLTLDAPFTVARYQWAIEQAVEAGYTALIIDSLSHVWAGEGGLLQQKEALDSRGGNSFTNWAAITRQHEALKAAILQSGIHIVATMRSKTDWVVEQDSKGKATPRKVGLAPVQREGMDYEFTVVFDLARDHTAMTSKDRTGLFDNLATILTPKHGVQIASWLSDAPTDETPTVPEDGAIPPSPTPSVTTQDSPKVVAPVAEPVSGASLSPTPQPTAGGTQVQATPTDTRKALREQFQALARQFEVNASTPADCKAAIGVLAPELKDRLFMDFTPQDWAMAIEKLKLAHDPNHDPFAGE